MSPMVDVLQTETRVLFVRDSDGLWYARRVKWNHQDDSVGEMIYHCDEHLGGPFTATEVSALVGGEDIA